VHIAIGSDHAGFPLKEHLKQTLMRLGHTLDDHGTDNEEPVDYPPICFAVGRTVAEGRADRGIVLGGSDSEAPVDYPGICASVARTVAAGRADRGIVIGGSGQGEQIAANKVVGVRAALCNDLYTARLSREHNDANVLSMGGRIVGSGLADEILKIWLETAFAGGRHQRRIDQIGAAEKRQTQ
jgi:ribose 5-phosphate isomerase B